MHNSSAGFQPEGPTISRRSVYAMFWPPSQIKTGFAAFRVHPGIVGRKVQRLHRLQHHAKLNALCARTPDIVIGRSEEHTSELQSLMRISYAVFCLKKKTQTKIHITHITIYNTHK